MCLFKKNKRYLTVAINKLYPSAFHFIHTNKTLLNNSNTITISRIIDSRVVSFTNDNIPTLSKLISAEGKNSTVYLNKEDFSIVWTKEVEKDYVWPELI